MAISNQKLKTFYILQILLEKTDENHVLSAKDLNTILDQRHGLTSDRKSIYSDIELLQEVGFDIVAQKGSNPGYYIASRDFELPELKLLVDAVQSSKFITTKKSEELINKLKKLTNEQNAKNLQREVYIQNRIKADNETIYYNVDYIHTGIHENKQIQFKYTEWTIEGKAQYRHNGAFYKVSPWAVTWDDDYYYLVAYEESSDLIKHFRVDKMREVSVLEDMRLGADLFEKFDLAEYSKKTFGMFHGEDERITFICKNSMVGVVIDRFGKDISIRKADDEHIKFSATVSLSAQFFGWLTGVGQEIQIESPQRIKDEYKKYLKEILSNYE